MMMMCVPHFFRVLWRASFFFFLSRPSLLRRLVIHSRGAHPTTTTRLFFFLFFSLCVQIEAREREGGRSIFFPLFIHLFMYTKYAPVFCWMPAEELVYYNVSVSASFSLSLCLCVAFHFNSRWLGFCVGRFRRFNATSLFIANGRWLNLIIPLFSFFLLPFTKGERIEEEERRRRRGKDYSNWKKSTFFFFCHEKFRSSTLGGGYGGVHNRVVQYIVYL